MPVTIGENPQIHCFLSNLKSKTLSSVKSTQKSYLSKINKSCWNMTLQNVLSDSVYSNVSDVKFTELSEVIFWIKSTSKTKLHIYLHVCLYCILRVYSGWLSHLVFKIFLVIK